MITRIEIDGYKSFEGFSLHLPPFAVLVGANASGKSNLLEAVDLLGQLIREPTGQALVDHARRGGPKELFRRGPDNRPVEAMRIAAHVLVNGPEGYCLPRVEAEIRYADPPDPLCVSVLVSDVPNQAMRDMPLHTVDVAEHLVTATKDWRILEPTPRAMRVVSSTYDTAPLAEDGKNLGAVLGRIARSPEGWRDFQADVAALLPDLVDVTVEANTEWAQWDVWLQHKHEHRMTTNTASAGTLRVLALLAAAHDPDHEGVLMLEEPENHLHPSRIPQLLQRLRGRTSDRATLTSGNGRQTLITSHSPVTLAAALDMAPESVVFLDTVTRFDDGQPPRRLTRVRKVADEGERGTFVTPLEVRKYLDPVGRFSRGA
ncbi:AAA family ATPase [Streptomyces odontomachi]|uniref:AAA family ATPase n=1 Tax=Streptomyces odontomachi TaxID=2944940 RepID=UPI00210910D4|nr:ATP-binding protein [Streptomyces sp. ODS25]